MPPFMYQIWGYAVGGAALFGVRALTDQMFTPWAPDLGVLLSSLIYWSIFIIALALIVPFCYAGMDKLAERRDGASISN